LIQTTAKVISNEKILKELERPGARNTLGSWLIWLRCPEIARQAQPGQFLMVRCGEGEEHQLRRPLSIHRVNEDNIALFFATWENGKGTQWLSQLQTGDSLDLLGPLGNSYSINPGSHNLLLVAGGIGIAPLYFLSEVALRKGYSVKLLRGASGAYKPSGKPNPDQHYPKKLLPRGMEVETITSSPDGREGMVVDLLTSDFISGADQVFACGPLPMYKTMAQMPELKDKPVQVSLEVRMGCGLGICYGCTVKTVNGLKQACKHGPVFNLDEVLWDKLADI